MSLRFTEEYPEVGAAFSMDVKRILFSGRSAFQKITVIETVHLGKVLLIDDRVMLTEVDEFVYHEMISHVPLYSHPGPRNVLVIGGGDGGTVREVAKHPEVEHIDLIDIDRQVSEVCLEYLPGVAHKLLAEKVNCRFEDGIAYVKQTKKKYDVIIVDSTDPVSVGEGLFTEDFYRDCLEILNEDGILVNQAESPAFTGEWVQQIARKLHNIFPWSSFYQAHIPSYPSGHWLFGFASKKYHPEKDFQESHYHLHNLDLKYYNSDLHFAAFALPNFVRNLIEEA
ncbi:MAG TPA: polyamine aminopropyltransferase [Caldithrix sp.]|nr:polyamine aminopropyltransferase [Caldithrix sp.]